MACGSSQSASVGKVQPRFSVLTFVYSACEQSQYVHSTVLTFVYSACEQS
jgi:hypothetical protein